MSILNKISMRFNALLAFLLCFSVTVSSQDCGTIFDLKKLKRDNPIQYQEFLRIEKLTEAYRAKMASNPNARLIDDNGTITIPVVFHVLHNGAAIGTGNNIPDARLIDQIAVLNLCYSQTNDQAAIPQVFRNLAGNPNFQFVLACTDPNGGVTSGILRRQTATTAFDPNTEDIKNTNTGGDNPWPVDRYLNVWIAPSFLNAPLLFGYAYTPVILIVFPNFDGCVVRFDVVGRNAGNFAGRTEGTTLVHEIGHWLNLIHPFDGGCPGDDFCADTPLQSLRTPETVTCPLSFPRNANICSNTPNGDMYDNFMDGTNENCGRRMFTSDQVTRMRAVFQPGGPRRSFLDNYFSMTNVFHSCTSNYFRVNTPFCAAQNNITWSVTGPISGTTTNQILGTFSNSSTANGIATVTASWGNYTTSQDVPMGWITETSNYRNTSNGTTYPLYSGGYFQGSSSIAGAISFTGATGAGTNWRTTYISGSASLSASGNSFNVYMPPSSTIGIAVDFPTACGIRTASYIFYRYSNQFSLSPNPASNNLRVKGTPSPNSTTARSRFAYDVEISTGNSQLVKKLTNISSDQDIDIDISGLRSNQFYTIRFISNNEVVVQQFFKG